jgi:hypothetical protein
MAIRAAAERVGGSIIFYYMENHLTVAEQAVLESKLEMLAQADGIIFFSLHQFRYGDRLHLGLMLKLLAVGLEIHFAVENISLYGTKDLHDIADFLLLVDHSLRSNAAADLVEGFKR